MTGSPANTRISRRTIAGRAAAGEEVGLQGVEVPTAAAAIAKAVTGAYLSSSGNAFSTRTASQIVQEHFPPAPTTVGLESGPLFGVQFSQLPCSDLSARMSDGMIGPQRSPLGLAADPGGFPLYKDGVVVGGIGVAGDGNYGFDPDTLDLDRDAEEFAALAGTQGFTPREIEADRIPRRWDQPALPRRWGRRTRPATGQFRRGGMVLQGIGRVCYNEARSAPGQPMGLSLRGSAAALGEFTSEDAYVLVDSAGTPRFPIRAGTDAASVANPLTVAEVRAVLEEAFAVLGRSRAQIRRPLDSRMQASISMVDTHGAILGVVRSPDGPIFGTDVSLQKARTAAFFSNRVAAAQMQAAGGAVAGYVQRVRSFLGDANALTGTFAFADRSGGNLSRPYFPDGEVGDVAGPLSVERPGQFSPFMTGLQTDLILPNLVQHLGFVISGGASADTPRGCTQLPDAPGGGKRIGNGIQIFPGSVPIIGATNWSAVSACRGRIDQDDTLDCITRTAGWGDRHCAGRYPCRPHRRQCQWPQRAPALCQLPLRAVSR